MVCFIHRPEYYKIYEDEKGNDLRGLAEIIIAKHRSGSVGDIKLKFRGEFVRFQNMDEDTSLDPTLTPWSGSKELKSRMNDEHRPDMTQQPTSFDVPTPGGFDDTPPEDAPF